MEIVKNDKMDIIEKLLGEQNVFSDSIVPRSHLITWVITYSLLVYTDNSNSSTSSFTYNEDDEE